MEHIFYFNSPKSERIAKPRLSYRSKQKSCKRRRGDKMDFSQHAFVAQVPEPTFCASMDASHIPHSEFGRPFSEEDNLAAALLIADIEMEDQVARPTHADKPSRPAEDEIAQASRSNVAELPRVSERPRRRTRGWWPILESSYHADLERSRNDSAPVVPHHIDGNAMPLPSVAEWRSASKSAEDGEEASNTRIGDLDEPMLQPDLDGDLGWSFPDPPRVHHVAPVTLQIRSNLSHPRPESLESSQEEESRRQRFALEDEEEDDQLRQRLSRTSETSDSEDDYDSSVSIPTLSDPAPLSRDRFSSYRTLNYGWASLLAAFIAELQTTMGDSAATSSLIAETLRLFGTSQSAINEALMDDDGLAVDDHRRSYDFSDFMFDWQHHYMMGRSEVPTFEPGFRSHAEVGRPNSEITPKLFWEGRRDMQGLDWYLLGPDRPMALKARRIMHPSKLQVTQPSSPDRACKEETEDFIERAYRFRSFSPRHQPRISHFQLRNALTATNRNEVFYSTGNQVMRTTLACPTVIKSIMDLSGPSRETAGFKITCLSSPSTNADTTHQSDRVVIAGGFSGEYAMKDLDSADGLKQGFVNHAYNGLVNHIQTYHGRRSGALQAAFCSNDRKVRIMDVKILRFTNTFTYEYEMNCSAISPDGRLRALVGDNKKSIITDADRGDTLVTLEGHTDYGFACSWSPDSRFVATGAQDGVTLIWDSRNWSTPLKKLDCVMSCSRSLQFTDDGTLVIAESEDVVSIYNKCDFTKAQDIRFFGAIAGVAVLDGGDEIIVANADRTVGGLLSFQKVPQGLNGGTVGRRVLENGYVDTTESSTAHMYGKSNVRHADAVHDLFV